jgi:sulfur transfer complex TusBCD TusB component (DsrH family)
VVADQAFFGDSSEPALDTAKNHAMSDEVSILLIQDGVVVTSGLGVPAYACKDDVLGRGVTTSA